MSGVVAGIDIGATKAHLRAVAGDTAVADVVVPSAGWRARPEAEGARWIRALLDRGGVAPADLDALVVGAQGCDSIEQARSLQHALSLAVPVRCLVVNDAELVVPAAGRSDGIGLISGTGSIAVGRDPAERLLFAGGWGWLVDDAGSAPALVRSAVCAVLRAVEHGGPVDPLAEVLMRRLDAPAVADLPDRMIRTAYDPGWGVHAAAVFEAADDGSPVALDVVGEAGAALADLVVRLRSRGVTSRLVVAGGGVVTAQPRLQRALRDALADAVGDAELVVLDTPPVHGAVRLARGLLATAPAAD